jgi:peptidoglycan L-alanyl-D-glutamate endopeptidase CwlK
MTENQKRITKWSVAITATVALEIFLLLHFLNPPPVAVSDNTPALSSNEPEASNQHDVMPETNRDANDGGSGREALVVDSNISIEEALINQKQENNQSAHMELVDVQYLGYDGKDHAGQIVVARDVAGDVRKIFEELLRVHFPIEKVIPIAKYDWNDQESIDNNNTSGFNYRNVIGPGQNTKVLSHHSFGRAIDLNPKTNPFVSANDSSSRSYDSTGATMGTITKNSDVVRIFRKYGWTWGGNWSGAKDYQHFEKLAGLPAGAARSTQMQDGRSETEDRGVGGTPSIHRGGTGKSAGGTEKPGGGDQKKPGSGKKPGDDKTGDPVQLRDGDSKTGENKGGDKTENSVTINTDHSKDEGKKGTGEKGKDDGKKGDGKKSSDPPPPDKTKTTGGGI